MADKFLNKTVLRYYHERLKTLFATNTDLTALGNRVTTNETNIAGNTTNISNLNTDLSALDQKVDEIIAEGGEPNKIDTVKVNGRALVPDAQKAVDIDMPEITFGDTGSGGRTMTIRPNPRDPEDPYIFDISVPADSKIVSLEITGHVATLASTDYVDENGGKIDVIKVNGTAQTITNKEVDLTVPTKTSDLTNDSTYQTLQNVTDLIDAAIADVTQFDYQKVDELPATGVKGTIYLVPDSSTPDSYVEWIYIEGDGWEEIGHTGTIDLSEYWSKEELTAITTAEIDELFATA